MSRPSAEIILEDIDDNMRSYAVCVSHGVYTVLYAGRPISIRVTPNLEISDYTNQKYPRTSFNNSGHAFNLAQRLNQRFCTDLFTVCVMYPGRTISEQ